MQNGNRRDQMIQIYSNQLNISKKQPTQTMGKMVTRFSKMHRINKIDDRSRSNSKQKDKDKQNKKQRESVNSYQLLSPIQKVDKYLAKFEKPDRTSPIQKESIPNNGQRNPSQAQKYASGEILYKKMHRRLQSAKLSRIVPRRSHADKDFDLGQQDSKIRGLDYVEKLNDSKCKVSGSFKQTKQISNFGQSINTMHSSDDYHELKEENKNLLLKTKKFNETIRNLENIIQKLLRQASPSNQSNQTSNPQIDNFRDLMVQTCQSQRSENIKLLEQISFLKKSKKLTTLHEQTIEINQLTKYCQMQAKTIKNMQKRVKQLQEVQIDNNNIEPGLETLKKHINDYQLILGKEENKIHELQNNLFIEKTKNKELLDQIVDHQQQVQSQLSQIEYFKQQQNSLQNQIHSLSQTKLNLENQLKNSGIQIEQSKLIQKKKSKDAEVQTVQMQLLDQQKVQKNETIDSKNSLSPKFSKVTTPQQKDSLKNGSIGMTENKVEMMKSIESQKSRKSDQNILNQSNNSNTENTQRVKKLQEKMSLLNSQAKKFRVEISGRIDNFLFVADLKNIYPAPEEELINSQINDPSNIKIQEYHTAEERQHQQDQQSKPKPSAPETHAKQPLQIDNFQQSNNITNIEIKGHSPKQNKQQLEKLKKDIQMHEHQKAEQAKKHEQIISKMQSTIDTLMREKQTKEKVKTPKKTLVKVSDKSEQTLIYQQRSQQSQTTNQANRVTIDNHVAALSIIPLKQEDVNTNQIVEKVEEKQFSDKGINTNLEKQVHFEQDVSSAMEIKLKQQLDLKQKQLDLLVQEHELLIVEGQSIQDQAKQLEGNLKSKNTELVSQEESLKQLEETIEQKNEKIEELEFKQTELVKFVEELQDNLQRQEQVAGTMTPKEMSVRQDFKTEGQQSEHVQDFASIEEQDFKIKQRVNGEDSPASVATFQATKADIIKNQFIQKSDKAMQTEQQPILQTMEAFPDGPLLSSQILQSDRSQNSQFFFQHQTDHIITKDRISSYHNFQGKPLNSDGTSQKLLQLNSPYANSLEVKNESTILDQEGNQNKSCIIEISNNQSNITDQAYISSKRQHQQREIEHREYTLDKNNAHLIEGRNMQRDNDSQSIATNKNVSSKKNYEKSGEDINIVNETGKTIEMNQIQVKQSIQQAESTIEYNGSRSVKQDVMQDGSTIEVNNARSAYQYVIQDGSTIRANDQGSREHYIVKDGSSVEVDTNGSRKLSVYNNRSTVEVNEAKSRQKSILHDGSTIKASAAGSVKQSTDQVTSTIRVNSVSAKQSIDHDGSTIQVSASSAKYKRANQGPPSSLSNSDQIILKTDVQKNSVKTYRDEFEDETSRANNFETGQRENQNLIPIVRTLTDAAEQEKVIKKQGNYQTVEEDAMSSVIMVQMQDNYQNVEDDAVSSIVVDQRKDYYQTFDEDAASSVVVAHDQIIGKEDSGIMEKLREIHRVEILLKENILRQVIEKKAVILENKVSMLQEQHNKVIENQQQEDEIKKNEFLNDKEEQLQRVSSANNELLQNLKCTYEDLIQDLIKKHNIVNADQKNQLEEQKKRSQKELNELEVKQTQLEQSHEITVQNYQRKLSDDVDRVKAFVIHSLNQVLNHSTQWTNHQLANFEQQFQAILLFIQQQLAQNQANANQLKQIQIQNANLQQEHENIYKNSKNQIKDLQNQIKLMKANTQPRQSSMLQQSFDSSATEGPDIDQKDNLANNFQNGLVDSNKQVVDKEGQNQIEVEEYEYYEEYMTETEDVENYQTDQNFDRNKQQQNNPRESRKGHELLASDHSQTSVRNIPYPK